jgi:accessory colonization factor AcfC
MRISFFALSLCLSTFLLAPPQVQAQDETARPVLHVFSPHDSMPALREVADRFEAKNNVKMEVTGGATDTWKASALKEADVILSGSETMMEGYSKNLGIIDEKTIETFYLRPSTLLVRPGNPSNLKGMKDILKKNVKVMVVNGPGQTALWEDMIGQLKDADALNIFRKKIASTVVDTAAGEKFWREHEEIDVWLTTNSWGKDVPANAQVVNVEKDLMLYRSLAGAVTTTTTERELSLKFLKFLGSSQAERIFKANGWFKKDIKESKSGEETKLR